MSEKKNRSKSQERICNQISPEIFEIAQKIEAIKHSKEESDVFLQCFLKDILKNYNRKGKSDQIVKFLNICISHK